MQKQANVEQRKLLVMLCSSGVSALHLNFSINLAYTEAYSEPFTKNGCIRTAR